MEDQQEWETALLKKIEVTVQETLTNCLQGLQITTPQPTAEKSEPPVQPDPSDASKPFWTASEGCTTSGITTEKK